MGIRVFMFRIVSRAQFERIIFMIRMQNERVAKAIHIGSLYPGVEVPADDVIIREHPDLVPIPRYMQPSVGYWACDDYFLSYDDIFANAHQIYISFTTSSTCEEYYSIFEEEFGRDFFGTKKPKWYGGCGDHCRSMIIHREEGDDELEALPTYVELTQWATDSFENPTYVQPPTPTEPREVRLRREDDVIRQKHSKASMIANEGKKRKKAIAQAERRAREAATTAHQPEPAPSASPTPPVVAAAAAATTSAPSQRIRTTLHNRVSHSHYAVHSRIIPSPSIVATPPSAAPPATTPAQTTRAPRRKRTSRAQSTSSAAPAPAPAPPTTSLPPSGV